MGHCTVKQSDTIRVCFTVLSFENVNFHVEIDLLGMVSVERQSPSGVPLAEPVPLPVQDGYDTPEKSEGVEIARNETHALMAFVSGLDQYRNPIIYSYTCPLGQE